MRNVDVAIVGGGLSGNLLARQLRLEAPEASVAMYERSTERAYKVGESTVEIAAHYLTRRLRLSTYLYTEHLPKFGLRYFFDSPGMDSELTAMSEVGTSSAPLYPSFQLDRARLEADLLEMNRDDGVDVRLGARVKDLALADASGRHTFTVVEDGAETHVQARWVIDCTGRESLVAKQKDLRRPETEHRCAASWGRFHGVLDMDGLDADEWHARARHSARVLATNHFMYDGYWIWFIPLRHGLTSIGLVQESGRWGKDRHSVDGFLAYLRQHRAVASLIENVEPVDLAAYTQLAFRTEHFFSPDRWALVGDAAAFTDPFYSPGSDFISVENDLVVDLVMKDLAGEDLTERATRYDQYMQYRYDTIMCIYRGLYPTFGSYDLFQAKVFFDTAVYYGLLFDSYARDEHRDLRFVRSELRRRHYGLSMMNSMCGLFRRAADELKETGRYHERNTGEHSLDAFQAFGVVTDIGAKRSRREQGARTAAILNETQKRVTAALGQDSAAVKALNGGSAFDAWGQLAAG